tara:strand:+ start:196 stop:357 length:162 start_codon:yes stop_codon:yes gene_type:complete
MEEGVTEYFIALLALMIGLSVGILIGCYITTKEAKEAYRGAKKLNELLNRPYD